MTPTLLNSSFDNLLTKHFPQSVTMKVGVPCLAKMFSRINFSIVGVMKIIIIIELFFKIVILIQI